MTDQRPLETSAQTDRHRSLMGMGDLGWSIVLWGLLLGWSLWRVPLPGVNETHYLTKARFFWNPHWCPGDLFLKSSNPHLVFYITVGWLTRFLSLPQTAVLGRAAGLLVVALGWQSLGRAVTGSSRGPLLALPFLALLQVLGNWSGEWLVGGIESKVFGYGFLMLGVTAWLQGHSLTAGACLGGAVSFHPIVGGWGVASLLLAVGFESLKSWQPPCFLQTLPRVVLACLLGLLLSLPGVLPALATLSGSSKQMALDADYLQFAGRLSHHLDPMMFPVESYRYFGMQLLTWALLWSLIPHRSERQRRWHRFVFGALLIALVGLLLGAGPRPVKLMPGWEWRISLLKFYPFRLADLLVPIAVAVTAAKYLGELGRDSRKARLLTWGLACAAYLTALLVPGSDRNPSRMPPERLERWVAALEWLKENTPPEDLIHCYDEQYAVRWFAERPEYVNYKDCPQDAPGLLEWNQRLWLIAQWNRQAYLFGDGRIDAQELHDLHKQTGIRWFVCSRKFRVEGTPAYSNRDFLILRLKQELP